jgi:hypothetical protein
VHSLRPNLDVGRLQCLTHRSQDGEWRANNPFQGIDSVQRLPNTPDEGQRLVGSTQVHLPVACNDGLPHEMGSFVDA